MTTVAEKLAQTPGRMVFTVTPQALMTFFNDKEVIEYCDGKYYVWYDPNLGNWRSILHGEEINPKTCKYGDNDITYHGYGLPNKFDL